MQRIFDSSLAGKVFGLLSPMDAVKLVAVCRSSKSEEFQPVLAFACSRPEIFSSSASMSMHEWKCLLGACVQSVAAVGLDPGVWAYSKHVAYCLEKRFYDRGTNERSYVGSQEWVHKQFVAGDLYKHLCSVLEIAQRSDTSIVELVQAPHNEYSVGNVITTETAPAISTVLMLDASAFEEDIDSDNDFGKDHNVTTVILTLAVLTSGQFALIYSHSWHRRAVVLMHETLSALFDLVGTTSGEECQWQFRCEENGNKFLTLSGDSLFAHDSQFEKFLLRHPPVTAIEVVDFCNTWPRLQSFCDVSDEQQVGIDASRRRLEQLLTASWQSIYPPQLNPPTKQVIQLIEHAEPPAYRDEQLLTLQANFQWTDNVEIGLSAESATMEPSVSNEASSMQTDEKVHILRFGSPAGGGTGLQDFRTALLEGPELARACAALQNAGHSCQLEGGALMFVKPEQAMAVQDALVDCHLHHFHIVITESFEYLVDEVLEQFSFQMRPKKKSGSRGRVELSMGTLNGTVSEVRDPPPNAASAHSDELEWPRILVEERTFLSYRHELRDAKSVAQSTTEASLGGYKGLNPRRFL